jgi:hypothetical protein
MTEERCVELRDWLIDLIFSKPSMTGSRYFHPDIENSWLTLSSSQQNTLEELISSNTDAWIKTELAMEMMDRLTFTMAPTLPQKMMINTSINEVSDNFNAISRGSQPHQQVRYSSDLIKDTRLRDTQAAFEFYHNPLAWTSDSPIPVAYDPKSNEILILTTAVVATRKHDVIELPEHDAIWLTPILNQENYGTLAVWTPSALKNAIDLLKSPVPYVFRMSEMEYIEYWPSVGEIYDKDRYSGTFFYADDSWLFYQFLWKRPPLIAWTFWNIKFGEQEYPYCVVVYQFNIETLIFKLLPIGLPSTTRLINWSRENFGEPSIGGTGPIHEYNLERICHAILAFLEFV